MNKTIYKYNLELKGFDTIDLPAEAEILTIQTQNGKPCLWALVDPENTEKEVRVIEIFGTGHPIGCGAGVSRKYITTFQLNELNGGQLVFHVFERLD